MSRSRSGRTTGVLRLPTGGDRRTLRCMSRTSTVVALLALAAIVPASAQPAAGRTPSAAEWAILEQVIREAPRHTTSGLAYAIESRSRNGDEISTRTERYQPGGDPEWMLVSVDGAAPSSRDLRRYEPSEERGAMPAYADIAETNTTGARVVAASPNELIFALPEAAADQIPEQAGDFAQYVSTWMTIDVSDPNRPWVQSVRVFADQEFRPIVATRVESFEVVISYAERRDVAAFVATDVAFRVRGSALSRQFDVDARTQFTDVRRVGMP